MDMVRCDSCKKTETALKAQYWITITGYGYHDSLLAKGTKHCCSANCLFALAKQLKNSPRQKWTEEMLADEIAQAFKGE